MKALLLFMTTIMLSLFCSCDKNKTETELDGLASNSIHLSTRELKFDSSSSIKEVTTEGNRWMIYIITNEDTDLDYSEDNIVMTMGDIGKNENTPLKIEGDWFTITRELKKISVELKANDSNKKRVVKIGVNDRNYFDRIEVEQAGN